MSDTESDPSPIDLPIHDMNRLINERLRSTEFDPEQTLLKIRTLINIESGIESMQDHSEHVLSMLGIPSDEDELTIENSRGTDGNAIAGLLYFNTKAIRTSSKIIKVNALIALDLLYADNYLQSRQGKRIARGKTGPISMVWFDGEDETPSFYIQFNEYAEFTYLDCWYAMHQNVSVGLSSHLDDQMFYSKLRRHTKSLKRLHSRGVYAPTIYTEKRFKQMLDRFK